MNLWDLSWRTSFFSTACLVEGLRLLHAATRCRPPCSVDEQGHLHSEDESRTASDTRSALDTEEEGGEDGSLHGVCLPGGVVISNSPGLRSFERPSLPKASRLLQSSRQEGLPFCH